MKSPGRGPRPCIDYRNLNKITNTQYFSVSNIEERIETVAYAHYITMLDLSKGYWRIPQSQNAKRLAAFVTIFGIYIPLRMPFGLKNALYELRKMVHNFWKDARNMQCHTSNTLQFKFFSR